MDYLHRTLNDADSLEIVEWGQQVTTDDGTIKIKLKFRAKNPFGAKMITEHTYSIRDGKVVDVYPPWP